VFKIKKNQENLPPHALLDKSDIAGVNTSYKKTFDKGMQVNSIEQRKNRKDYKNMQEVLKKELLETHFEVGKDARAPPAARFASHNKEYFN